MDFKTFLEHFDTIAQAPNGIAKLRSLILDLAIQGKLVPQKPEDEPAINLLEKLSRIKEEVSERERIPKEKSFTSVEADEYCHDLPKGWVYTRLGEISFFLNGYAFKSDTYVSSSIHQLIRLGNVKNDVILLDQNPVFIPENIAFENQKFLVNESDLLITMTGTKSKRDFCFTAIVKRNHLNNKKLYLNQRVGCIRILNPISIELINVFLKSSKIVDFLLATSTGTANQANIGVTALRNLPIPLPPLAEQKRIVEKVDELMALCDRYQQSQEAQDKLRQKLRESAIASLMNAETDEELQKSWSIVRDNWQTLSQKPEDVGDLRRSILQLAMSGKLVSQDSTDQPASELIEDIRAKKQQLIQDKKIPKSKNIEPVGESDAIYQIPHTWSWIRLGEITKTIEYGTSEKASEIEDEVPVLRMNNIQNGKLIFENLKYVSASIKDLPKLYLQDGDLLFNRTNSYELVGKTGLFRGLNNQYSFASYLIRIALFIERISPEFINIAMNAAYFRQTQIEPEIVQQCGQANFNGTKLQNTLIPLPPLAEQERIVAKVDELMQMCDRLEESLRQSQQRVEALAASAISHLTV